MIFKKNKKGIAIAWKYVISILIILVFVLIMLILNGSARENMVNSISSIFQFR